MKLIFNKVLAVVVGIAAGSMAMMSVEKVGQIVFEWPVGEDAHNPIIVETFIRETTFLALVFLALAWAFGSWLGGLFTGLVAKSNGILLALIVGTFFVFVSILTLNTIKHPVWFWILGLSVILPSAYCGARIGSKRK